MSSAVLAREGSLPSPHGGVTGLRNRLSLRQVALAGVALAVLASGGWYGRDWWTNGRFIESTDDAYVGGNVTSIAPHVSGFVAEVLVTDNQRVTAGQVLVRLDPRDTQAALDHATAVADAKAASLDGLRAQYVLQQSTIRQQEADVAAKSAQLTFAAQDSERYRSLSLTAAGSRQDAQRTASLEQQARASLLASAAALEAGRQQLRVLEAQIAEAAATLAQARSDVQTAQLNLGYTEIRAPIDGYVGNRAAQVGAYVAAGAYLISVIPATGLWVDANFKEDQLTRMADGDAATVVADVLPGHVFHGHVASVAPGTGAVFSVIPAENATGNFTKIVQRVPVRVVIDAGDPELRMLRPGLSTTARVDTRGDAQKVAVR
jgi:membrane fusion protein (multidrug efflux system)